MSTYAWTFGVVVWLLVMVRNQCVYTTRIRLVIDNFEEYLKLPGYDSMMLKPRYWLIWTPKQWVKFLDRS